MRDYRQFYIDGAWVAPASGRSFEVINPATEAVSGVISLGDRADVDRAVAAARRAFDGYSRSRAVAPWRTVMRSTRVRTRRCTAPTTYDSRSAAG